MSSPLAVFRRALATAAVEALGLPAELSADVERLIRTPEAGRGDLALPCFELARQAKKNPPEAAAQVRDAVAADPTWATAEAAGPYVNVTFAPPAIASVVVPEARSSDYGSSDAGAGQTITIDFSSPNIAKPLAFHHVRSTVIGAAIGRIHAKQGWTVAGINYLGDWGKQFGLLATGFARHGDPAKRADAKHLVEVYVKANAEADVDSVKKRINAPAEAQKAVAELLQVRGEVDRLEGKAKKKAAKRVKSLEKRLRGQRGLSGDADPTAEVEPWYAALTAEAEAAKIELPKVEATDSEARLFFKRLEDGGSAEVAEWREFRQTSVAEFERVYARMGVQFASIEGESFYTDVLEQVIERATEKPGTKIDQGALIVDMPYEAGEPPVLLKTRDGTTLYITRDIAAAMDRFERFEFGRNLYVVAADQSLHFAQLFRTLAAMGFDWADRCHHVTFGRVHGMSTRRGNVVFLDEVLDEAVAKAREICEASEKIDRDHLDETIEAIGVGAVVFGDLKNLRTSDYTFRWEDVVNFDGLTGPYVQYTHARTCSIIKRAGGLAESADPALLTLDEERNVMMALARFPDAVAAACDAFEPSLLTRAVIDLAQSTAHYLTSGNRDRSKRILVEDNPAVQAARLHLVDAVRNVLSIGLAILGVRAPEAM